MEDLWQCVDVVVKQAGGVRAILEHLGLPTAGASLIPARSSTPFMKAICSLRCCMRLRSGATWAMSLPGSARAATRLTKDSASLSAIRNPSCLTKALTREM